MQELNLISQIILYALLGLIGLFVLTIGAWQFKVLRGETMQGPDGSVDDWHEQKILCGIAVADLFLACPAGLIGIILVLSAHAGAFTCWHWSASGSSGRIS